MPVHVTDGTALTSCPATDENGIRPVRCILSEDEGPGPAESGKAGKVGADIFQVLFPVRPVGRFVVHDERAGPAAMILGLVSAIQAIKGSIHLVARWHIYFIINSLLIDFQRRFGA